MLKVIREEFVYVAYFFSLHSRSLLSSNPPPNYFEIVRIAFLAEASVHTKCKILDIFFLLDLKRKYEFLL